MHTENTYQKKGNDMELLKRIAKRNGRETIFKKTKEECAELIVAISHFEEWGIPGRHTTLTDIYEEIADVEIMCEQLKITLLGFDAVERYKAEKIERQAERFGLTGNKK
jgi:NTP pyrophosphatase (non-canonical NTP hydrolase)